MKTAGAAIAGLALGGLFTGFIEDARESARVSRLTEAVLKSTGGAAHVTAQQVGDLATAISNKTGIDDEAIQSASNLLLTFTKVRNEVGKGNDVFDQATQLAADMSVVLGGTASDAAKQLGKALNDPIKGITALSRAGVSFTAEQKEQIKTFVEAGDTLSAQKIILQELSTEFGGAAEAASDPLQRLGTIAGNLGEDIGTLLLPVVSDLADFAAEDLIPAIRDAAGWLGDNFGSAISQVGSVISDVVDIGAGLAGFFSDLPGPIQLGAVAAAGWAVAGTSILNAIRPMGGILGPLRGTMSAFSEALGYARANGDGLGTVLRDVGSYAGGQALSGIKKLAQAIGPELAIGAAVFAVSELVSGFKSLTAASDEAEAAASGLADSLTLVDEAADRRAVRGAIEDVEGLVEILDAAGVSSEDAINGLLGQADAQDRVTHALEVYMATKRTAQTGGDAADVLEAINNYDELATSYGNAAGNARYFADESPAAVEGAAATGQAAEDSIPQIDEAAQAVQRWRDQLQQVGSSFVDPLDTYKSLLQDAAQATADATSDATDSWSDYATDAKVSLDEFATNLQNQITAQNNWRTNLVTIAQRGGIEVAQALEDMGVEGAGYVQQLVDASDEDFDRLVALMIQDANLGGAGAAAALDDRMKVMAAVGEQGASATVQGIAAELGLGADRVREITESYGVHLAEGVNPILAALGKPRVVPANNGQRQYFYADGGFTGPGAKYEPAGVVHKGEFVVPKEKVDQTGPDYWYRMAGMRGYASGGYVTEADVPRPYSTAPYGVPLSTAGDAAMDTEFQAVSAFVREGGPFGRALAWARSQVGKPYIWGGVGPAGYDCSGFQSAIANVLLGQSPYSRRGSTATFPWPGFAPGDGVFTVGSTPNAGGGIGHMAGTLLGVNVESRGGQGVVVGGSARGAHDGLFSTRAHLAMANGGVIGEPVFGFGASGRSYSFGERGPETVVPGVPMRVGSAAGRQQVNVAAPQVTVHFHVDGEEFRGMTRAEIDHKLGQITDDLAYAGGA
jgi:hypothetical protein